MISLRRLSPKPLFKSARLSIRGVGIHEVMPPSYIQRPSGTGDFLFMLFHDAVELGPTNKRVLISPSTMILWPKNAAHFYGNIASRWSHSWIHCDGLFVSQIIRSTRLKMNQAIHVNDPTPIDRYLFELHAELAGPHPTDGVIVSNLMENMLREVARASRQPRRLQVPENIARSKSHIDANYDVPATLGELAKIANLSARHFCTEFARHYRIPPIAYLIHTRLQAAATLVRGTTESIGEIGRRVGYHDPYHFSKHFKAYFGVSPSQLRMQPAADMKKPRGDFH